MKTLSLFLILFFISSSLFPQTTNDDCSSAESISVITASKTDVSFNLADANIINEVGCVGETPEDYVDIWYTFTMPVNGNVYVDGAGIFNKFALYDSCGGVEISCFDSDNLIQGLTQSSTYWLRLFRNANQAASSGSSFDIQAFEIPLNDQCNSPETIAVNTASATDIDFTVAGATIVNEVGCNGETPEDYVDIWYSFNMPVNGNVYIDGAGIFNKFALYDSCGGLEISCFDNDKLVQGLAENSTYWLRVYRSKNRATSSGLSFDIQAFEIPLNDECNSPETIAVTTASITEVDFTIAGAAIENEVGCDGETPEDYVDIWYSFTMPVNGNVVIDGAGIFNKFALYDSCGGNEISCFNNDNLVLGLSENSTYWLRVYRNENRATSSGLSFDIQAFEVLANDDCANPETLAVTTASATNVDFTIAGAVVVNEVGCAGETPEDYVDIWYSFTMPVDGNVFINGSGIFNKFALYDSCGGNEISCFDNINLVDGLSENSTYWLRVFRNANQATSSGLSFDIQAFEIPLNDDCNSPETIAVTTASTTNIDFTIAGAAIVNEVGCEGETPQDYVDLWYSFSMPVNGNVFIDGTGIFNNFALYDSCGGVEISCFDNDSLIEGLIENNTYWLRLFRNKNQATSSGLSFNLQAFEVVPNDDCTNTENIDLSSGNLINIDFSITGANLNNEEGCSGSGLSNYADVWYDFQMPFEGDLSIDGNSVVNQFAIYDACNGTELHCFSNEKLIQDLTEGENYVLRVFRTETQASNSNFQNFSIQAFENSTNCASLTIWDGTSWSNGLPDATTKAVINDDFQLTTTIEWCELEIVNGSFLINQSTVLTLNESSNGLNLRASGELEVEGVLDIAGNIENNGNILFKSNLLGSGQLDTFTGTIAGPGNVTTERFIPAGENGGRRAFRLLSSAINSSGNVRANWQEGVNNTGTNFPVDNKNPNEGYGIHITGSQTGANGFDATPSGNPSMFTFDNTFLADQPGETQFNAWIPLPNTDTKTLIAGEPYLTFVRGDRSINVTINSAIPTNTTLRTSGNLHVGDYSPTLSNVAGFYSLIGNPYQAIVNFSQLSFNGDVNPNNLYVWNPNLNTRGAYETINTPEDQIIQPGQSVFVQNSLTVTTSPGITFTEADKNTSGMVTNVFDDDQIAKAKLDLYNSNGLKLDQLQFSFEANANNGIDDFDAGKLSNPDENLASVNNSMLLSIEKRAIPQTEDTVPLFIGQYRFNDYKFKVVVDHWNSNIDIFIIDNYLDIQTLIEPNQDYSFNIDSNIPESIASNRFSLSFNNATFGVNENIFGNDISLYPNPTQDGFFSIRTQELTVKDVNLNVYNILGQVLMSQTLSVKNNNEVNVDASNLLNGVYLVKIEQEGQKFIGKLIVE